MFSLLLFFSFFKFLLLIFNFDYLINYSLCTMQLKQDRRTKWVSLYFFSFYPPLNEFIFSHTCKTFNGQHVCNIYIFAIYIYVQMCVYIYIQNLLRNKSYCIYRSRISNKNQLSFFIPFPHF